jgi:hypothetical protein
VNDASVGTIRLDRRFAGWFGKSGVRVDGPLLHFVLNNAADTVIRPHEPGEGALLPIVASPALARAAGPTGIVSLHAANHVVDARVVATTRYFPSVDGEVVVADLPSWLTAANTLEPGVATASELWTRTAPPPGTPLEVVSQRAREQELTSDPLARGAISLLLVIALVGLGLAAAGLLLTVIADLRDERGALFDLSAQGATPAQLRRHVLLRAGIVGALGLAGGIAAGAIVGTLVVAIVTVSAAAEDSLPPLALVFDVPRATALLAALVVVAAAAAVTAARRGL